MSQQSVLITIFGATGDLASRKLYPALFRLFKKGYIGERFAVIGTARREWSDDYFRSIILDSLASFKDAGELKETFISHFYYLSHNVNDSYHYEKLKILSVELDERYDTKGNRIFYLAMAPQFFQIIGQNLKEQGILTNKGYNRLVIEKPFGKDYETASELNNQLRNYFDEDQIYRIDHYLGKEMIQNITAVRFANRIFETLWSKEHISNIQITLAEEVGVEDRGGYYETSGALRDMVQNHILQILALVAMEPPTSIEDIREKKIQVLKQLRQYTPEEVEQYFVRGQYGPSKDGKLLGYRQDSKVADDSQMETFVAGKVLIDNERWEGVPFYIRTGKSMGEKKTVIHVQFKKAASSIFSDSMDNYESNRISIHITPKEGFCFILNSKEAGQDYTLHSSHLERLFDENFALSSPEAYERLLLDCMKGDMANFTHWEEVAASWKFIDCIRQTWDKHVPEKFPNYHVGEMGPQSSCDLLAKDHVKWI